VDCRRRNGFWGEFRRLTAGGRDGCDIGEGAAGAADGCALEYVEYRFQECSRVQFDRDNIDLTTWVSGDVTNKESY